MTCFIRHFGLILSILTSVRPASLHPLFGDNTVLQHNAEVTVWGWLDSPGEKVTVELRDAAGNQVLSSGEATTSNDAACGRERWEAKIKTNVTDEELQLAVVSDVKTVISKAVRLGHVIVCDGQSNMWYHVDKQRDQAVPNPNIRSFIFGQYPMADGCGLNNNATWISGDNPAKHAAVCYFAASRMSSPETGLAVGAVVPAAPGEGIDCFVSGKCFTNNLQQLKGLVTMGVSFYQGEANAFGGAGYADQLRALITTVYWNLFHSPRASMTSVPVVIVKLTPKAPTTSDVGALAIKQEDWTSVIDQQQQIADELAGDNVKVVKTEILYEEFSDADVADIHLPVGKKLIGREITAKIYECY